MEQRPSRLGIVATHPIQYFAPVRRLLPVSDRLEVAVHFLSDHSIHGDVDPGFGVSVGWDVPLLDGYAHRFLNRSADLSKPWSVSLPNAGDILAEDRLDVVLVHGYTHKFEHQIVNAARSRKIGTAIR